MNIFWLDNDIEACVRYHFDKHCTKMVSEYTQMLSTNYRLVHGKPGTLIHPRKGLIDYDHVLVGEEGQKPIIPLKTHENHPCNKWVRASRDNYNRLWKLSEALEGEYYYRYGAHHKKPRRHSYYPLIHGILSDNPIEVSKGVTSMPMTMGKEFIISDDPVISYRNFIVNGKAKKLHRWKDRPVPEWLADY